MLLQVHCECSIVTLRFCFFYQSTKSQYICTTIYVQATKAEVLNTVNYMILFHNIVKILLGFTLYSYKLIIAVLLCLYNDQYLDKPILIQKFLSKPCKGFFIWVP